MKLIVSKEIFEKFPGLIIGAILAKDVDNCGECEDIQSQLRIVEEKIRENYSTETLSQNPKIDAWRKAYSLFGAKPKENKSSVESLYRTVLNGSNIRHINRLVDAYNLVSLKHMLPAGGEDLDKIRGNIVLKFAEPNETPVLLLGDKEPRPPHAGEIIYRDNDSAICRRWNWREADRSKLGEKTKNAILVIEALPPLGREDVEKSIAELKALVEKFCGGMLTTTILDDNSPEFEFSL